MARVGEVMRTDVQPIAHDMTVGELAERISGRAPEGSAGHGKKAFNLTEGLPIVGSKGELVGIVTQTDLLRSLEDDPLGGMTVIQAGTKEPIIAYPDELAHDAMYRMLQNNIGRMPVVSREDPHK